MTAMNETQDETYFSRREAILSIVAALCTSGIELMAADDRRGATEGAEAIEAVQAIARKADLGTLRTVKSQLYQVIGDGDPQFLRNTAVDCEAVAYDYYQHFRARGFELTIPRQHLTVIAAGSRRSFVAFLGADPGGNVGGLYDRDSNRLIVFDYRPNEDAAPLRAGYANMLTLAHEASHQLAFNSGLLARKSDTPVSIVEGLAMYGEVRKFSGRNPPGAVNGMRLDDLARLRRMRGNSWMSVQDLLRNDDIVRGVPGTLDRRLQGYAQSWLLVYQLMTDPKRLPGFRNLLAAFREGPEKVPDRLGLCETHLGPLDELDEALQSLAIDLMKRNPATY